MADEPILQISELFYSIQGESTLAGAPCTFIRLADCNLRCSYCDASYTYEEPGQDIGLAELLAFVDQHPVALVEITGGEPLLQEGVYPLFDALLARGRQVLLETNGSVSLARVPAPVIKVMDIKCPSSTMHEQTDLDNLQYLAAHDNLKFVISNREDFDWAVRLLSERLPTLGADPGLPTVLFSPVTEQLHPASLVRWIMEAELPVRLQLQLHKIIWPNQKRGI